MNNNPAPTANDTPSSGRTARVTVLGLLKQNQQAQAARDAQQQADDASQLAASLARLNIRR
ncbi:MAG: hypothetical protein COW89_01090 [Nitrospinae bacterium CG22_combo_CG10-13_8_21_14_all_47_10]|nr:MAG: hypothetical protein COW89_01090 [Nitrospinae bacterium CG22_combo_CG10-13_8_21_14_all_47_10]PIQ43611.1 MAG: hypothetical protein COW05_03680 [Gammaproteobacteria bacterium CG12_big_fil_rev_8_21_14_0_65_46_12]PIR10871.1 MAG: hypothetical protein COV52_06745 [Gammaproteobacteria bacterium CG11_big_fil_rev_8_21_14_0_20_46_22]